MYKMMNAQEIAEYIVHNIDIEFDSQNKKVCVEV